MRTRRLSGRLIGLLAAYLVALQALILPLSLPPTFAGTLCLTDATSGPAHDPADHTRGCPSCAGCGLLCHTPILAGGAAGAPIDAPQLRVAAALVPTPLEAARPPATRTPQIPRGPPAA